MRFLMAIKAFWRSLFKQGKKTITLIAAPKHVASQSFGINCRVTVKREFNEDA